MMALLDRKTLKNPLLCSKRTEKYGLQGALDVYFGMVEWSEDR